MASNSSLIFDFSKSANGWVGNNFSRRESISISNPPVHFKSNEAGYAESKAFTGISAADGGLKISASTDAFVIANFTVRQSTKQARASSINTAKSPTFEVNGPGIIEIQYNISSSDGAPKFQLVSANGQEISAVNAISGTGTGVARLSVLTAGKYQIFATASSYNFSDPYRRSADDGEGLSTTNLILKSIAFSGEVQSGGSTTTVNDTSRAAATPTYTISPSATSINEGQALSTTIRTTGVANGTTLYWGLSGTGINSSDLSSGSLTGQGTVNNGAFSFSHTLANDLSTNEGNESLQIKLFSDSARTRQVGSTATVTVNDTSRAAATPTYTISPSATSINEGSALSTTIRTTGVANGTTLYWGLSGTGINSSDLSSGSLTGQGTVSNGAFSFAHTLRNDLSTNEGSESLQIKLFSDAARTKQVGSTATVTVNDTSKAAAATYTISPSTTSINEGSALSTTIRTTGVANGTTLYWGLSGTGINASDFSSGSLTGQGTVSNGAFSFAHTLRNDLSTNEGSESLQIKLFSDAARTKQVGSTATVTVNDTSKAVAATTDTKPPDLISYELSTYDVDLSKGDAIIGVSARITDDLSGVFDGTFANGIGGSASQARWVSPSGSQSLEAGYFASPTSGTSNNAYFTGQTTTLSRFAETGVWTLQNFYLADEAGNSQSLNATQLAELGIRTTLNVADGTASIIPLSPDFM